MATLPTFVLCLQDTDTPSKETRIPTAIKVLRKHNDLANQVRIDCCITGIRARLVFTPGITGTALDKLLSKGAGLHYRAQRGFHAAFVDLESVPKTYDRVYGLGAVTLMAISAIVALLCVNFLYLCS